MRAAIRVQEALGRALAGDEADAQRLLDEAHQWAADDSDGDARGGHGSFCTESYIEINRADCWLKVGRPDLALDIYERAVPALPSVYQRDRAAALGRMALAYAQSGQPEAAATTARVALPVARDAGSQRIVSQIGQVGARLEPQKGLSPVAALLADLEQEAA
jgi:tetratricopeptide (TPR) repeat protein